MKLVKLTQNICPACYSLSQRLPGIQCKCDYVRRGAIFAPKCIRNCLAAGLCPDPLRSVHHCLIPPSWIEGVRSWRGGRVMGRLGRKWKKRERGKKGERGRD